MKWTLNRLLDNIPELLHLRGLSSYSRKRLIEQLADLEEQLNALDRPFQRQSDPLSPDQYHVVFPDNHAESFDDETEFVKFILDARNKDPDCKMYSVYPKRCLDGLLLTEIGDYQQRCAALRRKEKGLCCTFDRRRSPLLRHCSRCAGYLVI